MLISGAELSGVDKTVFNASPKQTTLKAIKIISKVDVPKIDFRKYRSQKKSGIQKYELIFGLYFGTV